MSLQLADLETIGKARDQLGIPANAEATPAQVLLLLRMVPEAVAERMVSTWREQSQQAHDCWMRDHERQIDYWRDRALTADAVTRARKERTTVNEEER